MRVAEAEELGSGLNERLQPNMENSATKDSLAVFQTSQSLEVRARALAKHEPLGSAAMGSTCQQYQARFKRTGQLRSQSGDEALMCLETFRRNGRWHLLIPRSKNCDPCKH